MLLRLKWEDFRRRLLADTYQLQFSHTPNLIMQFFEYPLAQAHTDYLLNQTRASVTQKDGEKAVDAFFKQTKR